MAVPNPVRIAVVTDTPSNIDVVYTYQALTNIGRITILLYDNLIPLNIHAIISDKPINCNYGTPVIVDEHVQVQIHLQNILKILTCRNDLIIL